MTRRQHTNNPYLGVSYLLKLFSSFILAIQTIAGYYHYEVKWILTHCAKDILWQFEPITSPISKYILDISYISDDEAQREIV